jgi:threonine/homoserine/homoserine lactone efflux protein
MLEWFLIVFPLVFSPGPANIVALLSGAQVGLKRSIPLFLGIDTVYLAYAMLMGFGLGGLLTASPTLLGAMKYGGAACVVWFGIAMWRRAKTRNQDISLGFKEGIMFQALNPKFPLILLAMYSAFLIPGEPLVPQVFLLSFGILAMNIVTQFCWAGAGLLIGRFLTGERLAKFQDYVFGALLVIVGLWIAIR